MPGKLRVSYNFQEEILLKSNFHETTRKGLLLGSTILALTPTKLLLANRSQRNETINKELKIQSYLLSHVKLTIFKNSNRQCLKVCFLNLTSKYFELGKLEKRKIIWELWCHQVTELNEETKLWPFIGFQSDVDQFNKASTKRKRWTDKYIYLGTARELEDSARPQPIPGLGLFGNNELFYLKSKYFGCWDQSEHWVQCGNSSSSLSIQLTSQDLCT